MPARRLFVSAHQIGRNKYVRGRIVPPVRHEIVEVPESKLLDVRQSPSGSGGDVAKNERPIDYTGTGVGSPAAAFFKPETSRTALNNA
jgi:hypothetical protein